MVELDYQISGPGWKTWNLRLDANGKVVEERYDWSSKNYHSVRTRCKLTKEKVALVLEATTQLASSLPHVVDDETFIRIDGPYKRIFVHSSPKATISTWHSPDADELSAQASQFARTWQQVDELLTCGSRRTGEETAIARVALKNVLNNGVVDQDASVAFCFPDLADPPPGFLQTLDRSRVFPCSALLSTDGGAPKLRTGEAAIQCSLNSIRVDQSGTGAIAEVTCTGHRKLRTALVNDSGAWLVIER